MSALEVFARGISVDSRITLKKNYEFRRLYGKGKSAVTPYLVVYCLKNRSEYRRVGFTVSVKLGKAVVRNRVRRRLREIYRLNESKLKSGVDIVIVARGRSVGAEYAEIEEAFLQACAKLGLLGEEEA